MWLRGLGIGAATCHVAKTSLVSRRHMSAWSAMRAESVPPK
jgi:hypothetical protein